MFGKLHALDSTGERASEAEEGLIPLHCQMLVRSGPLSAEIVCRPPPLPAGRAEPICSATLMLRFAKAKPTGACLVLWSKGPC